MLEYLRHNVSAKPYTSHTIVADKIDSFFINAKTVLK